MTDLIDRIDPAVFNRLAELMAAARPYFEAFRASVERMNRGFIGGSVVFDELYDERDNLPEPDPGPLPDITIELGPQNWILEIRRVPAGMQFPRQWPRLFVSPTEYAVDQHWQQFTAPDFPVPVRPGYDFTRYVPAAEPNVWSAPPPAARHHTRPPATARRAPRHGRTRR